MLIKKFFFFFQAEDGIRDLVRSRGLGDVYKRQNGFRTAGKVEENEAELKGIRLQKTFVEESLRMKSVSYTHLTLPTSDLV